MAGLARITDRAFDPSREYAEFLEGLEEAGGVVSFVGLARGRTRGGAAVERLFLEHHPRLTQRSLDEIGAAALARFPVASVRVVHRYGEIAPGEPIVFVAAAASHRRPAFEAADYMMDRLKTEAVFWKREDAVDGARWIDPTQDDYSQAARWSD